jgi:hypothetical protein
MHAESKTIDACSGEGFIMRVYRAPGQMTTMPAVALLPMVGQINTSAINVPRAKGAQAWRSLVRDTPDNYFAATWMGSITVKVAGRYTFCTSSDSDDGSSLWVDGSLVVSIGVVHSWAQKCSSVRLIEGQHLVYADMFQNEGASGMLATWSGPDTGNAAVPLPCRSVQQNSFLMRVYKARGEISAMPDIAFLSYVGETYVTTINFPAGKDAQAWRSFIRDTPDNYFAATWTGSITVKGAGQYTFCTSSDDGSSLWVDGSLVVNNGGVHPTVTSSIWDLQCGPPLTLTAGEHSVYADMFQNEGGSKMVATWMGPDTGNRMLPVPSEF